MTVFRWLNNNIECIEINQATANWIYDIRLNNNMECIEIKKGGKLLFPSRKLNNNIRCIEINLINSNQI